MREYIEREKVLALAKDICVPTKWDTEYHHRSIDPLDVRELPAADVVERKRGKWVGQQIESIYCVKRCSSCGDFSPVGYFCYNCGAMMEER